MLKPTDVESSGKSCLKLARYYHLASGNLHHQKVILPFNETSHLSIGKNIVRSVNFISSLLLEFTGVP